jgi:hypothetical protein
MVFSSKTIKQMVKGCRSCWNDNRQPRDNQSDKIKKYEKKF